MKEGLKIQHSFTVSEKVYDGFQSIFQDKNILHTNPEYAKSKGFTDKVMYGNILNGFLSYFVGELLPLENVIIHKQEISFHNPVYLNEIIDLKATLKEKYELVNSYLFSFKFYVADKVVAKGKIQIGTI